MRSIHALLVAYDIERTMAGGLSLATLEHERKITERIDALCRTAMSEGPQQALMVLLLYLSVLSVLQNRPKETRAPVNASGGQLFAGQ